MDYDSAIRFLNANRPLPPDSELSDEVAATFDDVRRYFIANPDRLCIPMFLQAFGDGMGHGVYQICDDVFRCYDQSELTPHIVVALSSEQGCTRWWAAHWAMEFPDRAMLTGLTAVANAPTDADAHYFALAAIGSIWQATGDPDALHTIELRRGTETDSSLVELCDDILNS